VAARRPPSTDRSDRRGEQLLEEAARRSRGTARSRLLDLRTTALPIVQAMVAVGAAWLVAHDLIGHARPFFAPIASIITLGLTYSQRGRRSVELVLGVAFGIVVADLLISAIGVGTPQLMLVVGLAMVASVLVGGGPLFVTQAAVSGILVTTLQPPTSGIYFARPIDALVGGVIGFAVSTLLPADPLALARRTLRPLLDELGGVLEDVAGALEERDVSAAGRALLRARRIEGRRSIFHEAVVGGSEIVRMAPPRWHLREQLAVYADADAQLDLAIRNVRVLARGAIRAIELHHSVPQPISQALRELARAVRGIDAALVDEDAGDEARAAAIRAAGIATLVLERTGNLSVNLLVAQVRSTATDLLRVLGLERAEALQEVRAAAMGLEAQELA
jgi:uncharacterized membrane protein YgaE (UPF0421/DUF939 family)